MPHKILLIGPDAPLRASRRHLLERAGYLVKTATDHSALERLAEDGCEMVVLGASIPENGYAQLEDRLRQAHPRAFIVKIQQFEAHRGKAPDTFVENGMPAELLEAIATLFNLERERLTTVLPPRHTGTEG